MRKVSVGSFTEGVVLIPKWRNPTVYVSGRVLLVEVVEIILGEGLLETLPHQVGHPRDEDVA